MSRNKTEMKNPKFTLYFTLVLAMLFWGLTFVFYKFAFESFKPLTIILFRLIISVSFIYIAAKLLKKSQKVKKGDWKYLLLIALFEPFLYFLGETYGMELVSPTLGAVIIATIPLIVPIGAYFFYAEKLSPVNIFGLLISTVGVLAVILAGEAEWEVTLKGTLLMFAAVFSAVGYTLLVKKLVHNYNGFTITIWQNTFGGLMILPLFMAFEFQHAFSTIPKINPLLALIYLGVFGSSITFILFTRAVRELGAAKANIFANLIPVFTAVTAYFMIKEEMPWIKIIGIMLVLAGLILSQLGNLNKKKTRRFKYLSDDTTERA